MTVIRASNDSAHPRSRIPPRLCRNRVESNNIKELLGHDLRQSRDRITLGCAPTDLDALRDAVPTLIPKPSQAGQIGAGIVTARLS